MLEWTTWKPYPSQRHIPTQKFLKYLPRDDELTVRHDGARRQADRTPRHNEKTSSRDGTRQRVNSTVRDRQDTTTTRRSADVTGRHDKTELVYVSVADRVTSNVICIMRTYGLIFKVIPLKLFYYQTFFENLAWLTFMIWTLKKCNEKLGLPCVFTR